LSVTLDNIEAHTKQSTTQHTETATEPKPQPKTPPTHLQKKFLTHRLTEAQSQPNLIRLDPTLTMPHTHTDERRKEGKPHAPTRHLPTMRPHPIRRHRTNRTRRNHTTIRRTLPKMRKKTRLRPHKSQHQTHQITTTKPISTPFSTLTTSAELTKT
jgi:hypothetical protein